jgi:hypothetical protein
MLRITHTSPPAHSVDDTPMWIWVQDPAIDVARIIAEREKLGAATDSHPAVIYWSGATRFSLTAEMTVPEAIRGDGPATVTFEHYLKPNTTATTFELRSVGGREYAAATTAMASVGYYEFARRGLMRVAGVPGENGEPTTVKPTRGMDGAILDSWFDDMSRAHRELLDAVGRAVYTLSQNEVASVEGKP